MMTLAKKVFLSLVLASSASTRLFAQSDPGDLKQDPAPNIADGDNLVGGSARVVGGTLKISFTVANGIPTQWHHIYLNTDGSGSTGFIHSGNPVGGNGMDFLVEPNFLYRWSGADDQHGWHWDKVQPLEPTINGQTVSYDIPASVLNLKGDANISMMIETMNDNYQATSDTLPRGQVVWTIKASSTDIATGTGVSGTAALLPAAIPDANARVRFKSIHSYACYYGAGQTGELAKRDAVIVETRNLLPNDVATIKKSGTLVTGYISAGEDDKLRVGDAKGPGGYDSCYLDRVKKGVPDKNGEWNSYYVNPASPSWKAHFLEIAQKMEASYGVDGFFLDTIETATVYPDLKPAMISLIEDLRAAHPKSIIILNRGFAVIRETSSVVDGFMFEDFSAGHYFDDRGYVFHDPSGLDTRREQAERDLVPLIAKDGLVVLALDYAASAQEPYLKDAYDRARTFGFIPYASTYSLGTIFDVPYEGKADPKWERELSSPEALAVVLKDSANGFPKGTKVLPSSTYADYSVGTVTNGVKDRSKLDWRNEAWASQERETPHFLEFRFPKSVQGSHLVVDWASDHGEAFPSRTFAVEVKPVTSEETDKEKDKQASWKQIWAINDNTNKHCEIGLTPEKISALRIVQAAGGGSSARPNLMWVEQVQIH